VRKRFKIPLFVVALIAIAIGISVVVIYRSHTVENWVNRFLAEKLAAQYGLEVNISEIDGSLFRGFAIRGALVRFQHEGDTITLAYIPQAKIDYKISNFWHGRWIIDSVRIIRPQLYLRADDQGQWSIPHFGTGSDDGASLFAWDIEKITMEDASFDLALKDKRLHWFDLDIQASIRSEAGTYSFSLDTLRCKSDDARLQLNSFSCVGTYFENKLALQDAALITDSTRIAFSMLVDDIEGRWIDATIDSAHIHLPDVLSFLNLNLDGNIDLNGTIFHQYGKSGGNVLLSGIFKERSFDSLNVRFRYDRGLLYFDSLYGAILGGCDIEGFGNINFVSSPKAYHLAARVDSFDLNHLVPNTFGSDLSGRLWLDGRGFKPVNMIIDLDLRLDESYFDRYHFHDATGQMTIATTGLSFFPGFQIRYLQNRFMFNGDLDYRGDMAIECRADLDDLSDFAYQTFIDLPAGRADARFSLTGPTTDFDVKGECRSDSIWLYDFFSSNFEAGFDIHSFLYGMRGPIDVKSRTGDAWAFPYDSIYAYFTLDSNLLLIDTAYVANDLSKTTFRGVLDFISMPQALTLDTVEVDLTGRRFVSKEKQSILVDSNGFIFDHVVFNSSQGSLVFDGRADYDESLDIKWNIDDISILPWVELIDDSLDLDGKLSSTGRIMGKFENPKFMLQANIDSLTYSNLLLGDLHGQLSYEDSTLSIDTSFLKSAEGIYTAQGEFPINLALASGHSFFDDRQQDIDITASDKQLDLAAFILESAEYIQGDFTAEINVTGQPLRPHLNGSSSLKNGIVKLIDLRDRLEDVELEMDMADKLITIRNAQANVPNEKYKSQGLITVNGTILVKEINSFQYALNLQGKDVPIDYELGDFEGLVDARLYIGGATPPKVTGSILMSAGDYRESFEESGFSLLSALEADKSWDLDLMVDFPSNFWVKNSDIDAEFMGDLNILRTQGVYNFLGTLEVIRGKYFVFGKTFRMMPGGLIIYDNIEEPDPKLDLEMSTRIRRQAGYSEFESEDDYSYELNVAVTGTLIKPILSGAGDSPLSVEEIMQLLVAGYRPDDAGSSSNSDLTDRLASGGVDILASQVSKLGTRTLGVETFEINPVMGKNFDPLNTRVTIGAYTLPKLYIYGSSYVDVEKGQEVGVEYRLGRHSLFEGRRDESNLYHVNLKFHWEW
jgi:hypothetical protein